MSLERDLEFLYELGSLKYLPHAWHLNGRNRYHGGDWAKPASK